MNRKSIAIGITISLAIGAIVYTYLGGFKQIKLEIVQQDNYTLIGKHFRGKMTSDTLRNIFLETKGLLEERKIQGMLAIFYYEDVKENDQTIDCFTGIIIKRDKSIDLPYGYEKKLFKAKRAIRARFEGHRLVTPNPDDIHQKASAFAEENNIDLQPFFIEKYFSDNAIEIDYLIEDI